MSQAFRYSDTVTINFEVHGAGSRPLVLLHGFGASLESWRDIQPELETHFQLYLLDLKGHGLSSKPRDDEYSLQDQADIVVAFIENRKLSDIVLVGHSYGGGVAIMTYKALLGTGNYTSPIRALILIDTASYPQRLPFFVRHLRLPLLSDFILNFIPASWRASYTLHRLFFNRRLVTRARIDRYARFFDLPGAHYALKKCAAQIVPPNASSLISELARHSVPLQIIWGSNDPIIPPSFGERLQHDISGARLKILPTCGHIPQEEKPVDSSRIIITFLGGSDL